MKNFEKTLQNRYCLRYAGGIYWLLDCEQSGVPYREPIPMNELGADIWKLLVQEKRKDEIIDCICSEYDVDKTVAERDVDCFMKQLSDLTGEKYE